MQVAACIARSPFERAGTDARRMIRSDLQSYKTMRLMRIAVVVLLMVSALAAAKTLDMYVIDVEGSKAFLLVSPSGQSMLIDAGVPGSATNHRDADRIVEACKDAGVKKIDYMVVTHYDGDHVGGVPALAERFCDPCLSAAIHS